MSITLVPRPTPNFSARPAGVEIDCVVIHADAGKTDAGTINWIGDSDSRVSYHYFITRDLRVIQFVPDEKKAWHAGKSEFYGRPDVNVFSLGVAFANDQKGERFPAAQVELGAQVVAWLCSSAKHCIPLSRVTTHAVVSPGRKTDPGPLFPWEAFHQRIAQILAEGIAP